MMSVFLAGQAGKDTFVAPPPEPEAAATAEAPPTTNTEGASRSRARTCFVSGMRFKSLVCLRQLNSNRSWR
jgi:hypothetical protein